MSNAELQNFLNKFQQLRQDSFTAHLDVDAHAGQAWVRLHLMLESGPIQRPKHRSPSYLKRQDRRKAARLAAGNSKSYSDVVKASEAKTTEEVRKNSEDESLNLQFSSLSSNNVSKMEAASYSSIPDTSSDIVDSPEDNSSGSNREIINASTPEKQAYSSSKTAAVSPIKSIDWDKEIKKERGEWKKRMQEEGIDVMKLRTQFFDKVRQNILYNVMIII